MASVTRKPQYPRDRMGFNPFDQQSKSPLDIALVVGFVALTLAFIGWGFFG